MNDILLGLGDFRFSVETAAYSELSKTFSYRWSTQELLSNRPAKQYIGLGDETIEISGVILPHYKGGLEQIDSLKNMAGNGQPLALVDARGNVWGQFVINTISEKQSYFLSSGTPRKIEFTLSLAHYGGNDGNL